MKQNPKLGEQVSLPKVTKRKRFNLKEFVALAKKVKKITDKEKEEGFMVDNDIGKFRLHL